MKKTMSVVAIALMMAGSTVYACSSCGCQDKKAEKKGDKEKTECCKSQKEKTACGGAKKADEAKKAA